MHDQHSETPRTGLSAWRARITSSRHGALVWRGAVGVIGGIVLVAGIIAIPYKQPARIAAAHTRS